MAVQHSETVEIRGHLLDTGVLSVCVDDVRSLGGEYVIEKLDLGRDHEDESYARIRIETGDQALLDSILMRLNAHGVNLTDPGEVTDRVRRLLSSLSEGKEDSQARARVLRAGLEGLVEGSRG